MSWNKGNNRNNMHGATIKKSNHVLTAAGVWPDCHLETNLLCWARQWGDVGRQHTSRTGFIVAAVVNSKVVGL